MPTVLFFMFFEGTAAPSALPLVLWQVGTQLFAISVG
jgi:hypothetical protein